MLIKKLLTVKGNNSFTLQLQELQIHINEDKWTNVKIKTFLS